MIRTETLLRASPLSQGAGCVGFECGASPDCLLHARFAPYSAGTVLMQHLEGGPWTYLTVVRYNSWQDFATTEKNGMADTLKPDSGWMQLREHSTYHNDTLTDRIAP